MTAIRTLVAATVLLAGATMAQAQCTGDCNNSGDVAVNELVLGVNIALDRATLDQCPSFDVDNSGSVAVNELVTGVNNLLRDLCGDPATPTPTTSGGATPTPTVPAGPASCTFDGAAGPNQSLLGLCLLGQCIPPYGASGEFGVECAEGSGAGGAGTRDCSCSFIRFDPVEIPGVGFACVTAPESGECPDGVQDCNGTTSVNIDSVTDHETGPCSGNADCATKCDAYCAGLEPAKVRFSAACESFCQGGDRVNEPCECDNIPAATCNPASTLFCPNSSCEGKDNEADIDCHCQCIDESFGDTANAAGSMRCRLPTAIRVESGLPCDGQGVLVRLPPLCAPLTTGTNVTFLNHLNELTDVAEPAPLEGSPVACSVIDGGSVSDMVMVGNLTFFDSTVGDIISQLTLKCQ